MEHPAELTALKARDALSLALRALCLTRDYVGEELLPPLEGWDWYDAGEAICRLIPDDEWAGQFRLRVEASLAKRAKLIADLVKEPEPYPSGKAWADAFPEDPAFDEYRTPDPVPSLSGPSLSLCSCLRRLTGSASVPDPNRPVVAASPFFPLFIAKPNPSDSMDALTALQHCAGEDGVLESALQTLQEEALQAEVEANADRQAETLRFFEVLDGKQESVLYWVSATESDQEDLLNAAKEDGNVVFGEISEEDFLEAPDSTAEQQAIPRSLPHARYRLHLQQDHKLVPAHWTKVEKTDGEFH